ncbi:hypothetical protein KFU94_68660 [Chloroflexi bacterium TSY]|nr:hypothetical protein [Chloroflexi bacterium TSY]
MRSGYEQAEQVYKAMVLRGYGTRNVDLDGFSTSMRDTPVWRERNARYPLIGSQLILST